MEIILELATVGRFTVLLPKRRRQKMLMMKVNGMSCGHCVRVITKVLIELDSMAKVQIDLAVQTVRFDGEADQEEVVLAIQDAGYDVVETMLV
jgi:copper chaperone